MWRLAEIGPRRIGLSATVPAYIEAGLTQALCLNRPRVTRASVVRANIRYEVHVVKDEESAGKLLHELVGKDATAAGGMATRTMVFAGTEAMVNDITDRLGGHRYYTKMDPLIKANELQSHKSTRIRSLLWSHSSLRPS